MKNLKNIMIVAGLVLCIHHAKAQRSALTAQEKAFVQTTWYESPKESKGDTMVFRTSQYVLGPNDDPAYAFSKIAFVNNKDFTIEYWRKCTKASAANTGTWNFLNTNSIALDFGRSACKNEMQVIEIKADKLKVIIKE